MREEAVTLTAGETPRVNVEVFGDLILEGWDRSEVRAESERPEALHVTRSDDGIHIHCDDECRIDLPTGATVHVVAAHGQLSVTGLAGPLTVDEVTGNLGLRQVGDVTAASVHGNLRAMGVSGDLSLRDAFGNVSAQQVHGHFQTEAPVRGNLTLRAGPGSVSASTLGNASVQLTPQAERQYRIEARGNLDCWLPEDTSARVEIHSQARSIHIRLPERSQWLRKDAHVEQLGGGEARLHLQASGLVRLTGGSHEDPSDVEGMRAIDDLSGEIRQEIEGQMEALENRLDEQLSVLASKAGSAGLPTEEVDGMVHEAREASRRATRRAQEKAEAAARKAQEKLARQLEKARRAAEKRARAAARERKRAGTTTGRAERTTTGPTASAGPRPPAAGLDEEYMLVLRMLEEKKISAEEAERLIEAMEGN